MFPRNQILPPINSYYEPASAPILPPLRAQERMAIEDEYRLRMQQEQRSQVAQQQHATATQKEDKATGGVSAKLDYDMERMTKFVAESASGMYALHLSPICLADIDICRSIQPSVPIQPSFRKWVSQVLSATRLPSATILLSLHYLTVRLRDYPPAPAASSSAENHIYRLLAVALILGSKFLDDNTFINRSWSDVTGIRVSELNALEMDWLALIAFDLHCDPNDPSGLASWLRAWNDYDAHAVTRSRASRLSPLDTNVQRHSPRASRSPFQPQYKGSFADFTPQSSRPSSTYSTPYTSADPWNRTEPANSVEAFYNSQHRYPTLDELDTSNSLAALEQARRSTAYGGCALPLPPALASSYYSPWNQPTWGGSHPHGCNCMSCARQYMPFMAASGYPAQTVVG